MLTSIRLDSVGATKSTELRVKVAVPTAVPDALAHVADAALGRLPSSRVLHSMLAMSTWTVAPGSQLELTQIGPAAAKAPGLRAYPTDLSPESAVAMTVAYAVLAAGLASSLGAFAGVQLASALQAPTNLGAGTLGVMLGLYGLMCFSNALGPNFSAHSGQRAQAVRDGSVGVSLMLDKPLTVALGSAYNGHLFHAHVRGIQVHQEGGFRLDAGVRLLGFELGAHFLQAAACAFAPAAALDLLDQLASQTLGLQKAIMSPWELGSGQSLVLLPDQNSLNLTLHSDLRAPLRGQLDGSLNFGLISPAAFAPLQLKVIAFAAAAPAKDKLLDFAWGDFNAELRHKVRADTLDTLSLRTESREEDLDVDVVADFAAGNLAPLGPLLTERLGAWAGLMPIVPGSASWTMRETILKADVGPILREFGGLLTLEDDSEPGA